MEVVLFLVVAVAVTVLGLALIGRIGQGRRTRAMMADPDAARLAAEQLDNAVRARREAAFFQHMRRTHR